MATVYTVVSTLRLSRARPLLRQAQFRPLRSGQQWDRLQRPLRGLVARSGPTRAGTTLRMRRRRLPPGQPWPILANQNPAVAAAARPPMPAAAQAARRATRPARCALAVSSRIRSITALLAAAAAFAASICWRQAAET